MKPFLRVLMPLAGTGLLALLAALLPWEQAGAPLLVLCVLAAAVWLAISWVESQEGLRPALALFFGSLTLRLAASWLYSVWMGGRGWLDDAIAYDRVGWALAQAWRAGTSVQGIGGLEWVVGESFARVVAAVYWVLGHSPGAVIVLNAVLGAAAVYILYRLGTEILGEEVGRLAGWMCALYSGFWVYSLMPLKDALIMTSALLFFWSLHRLMSAAPRAARLAVWGPVALVSGASVVFMRDYVFIAVALGGIVFVLVRATQDKRARWFLVLGIVVLALAVFPLARRLAGYTLPLANFGAGSVLASMFGDLPTSATLAELGRWAVQHPLLFIAYLGLSLISTILAPYAWILPGAIAEAPPFGPYTVGFAGMWLWYLVLPFAVFGVWSSLRRSRGNVAGLLVFVALLLVLFSLTIPRESRHRDLIMPVLLLIAAEGIVHGWRLRRLAWFAWGPLMAAAIVKLQAWGPLAAGLASGVIVAALLWLTEHRGPRTVRPPAISNP